VSLTSEKRAQILSLYRVEGVSIRFIAAMMGLSRLTVRWVVHQVSPRDTSAQQKAQAMLPLSKGRVERQLHRPHTESLRRGTS
jgi:DNA-directed RNA polymerase specialized sigma24 family protein